MIRLFVKTKIAEFCIDTFFDKVFSNFISFDSKRFQLLLRDPSIARAYNQYKLMKESVDYYNKHHDLPPHLNEWYGKMDTPYGNLKDDLEYFRRKLYVQLVEADKRFNKIK